VHRLDSLRFEVELFDPPGSTKYVKSLIRGLSQASTAVLVVSADPNELEVGLSDNGKIREHSLLGFTFGIKSVVVLINKMDVVGWEEEAFNQTKDKVFEYLGKVGYQVRSHSITCIPVSALTFDNFTRPSSNSPWYTGPSLLQAIDAQVVVPFTPEKPLRMPIRKVFKVKGVGTVVEGRVEYGTVKEGMIVQIAPDDVTCEVLSIMKWGHPVTQASFGEVVTLQLSPSQVEITRGSVVSDPQNTPAAEVESYTAQIIVLRKKEIRSGFTPVVYCLSSRVATRINTFFSKIDRRTGRVTEDDPAAVKNGDAFTAELVPMHPVCLEAFAIFPRLGRFAIYDNGRVAAVGVVKSVVLRRNWLQLSDRRVDND
jgi:elongation factor 1-alpha